MPKSLDLKKGDSIKVYPESGEILGFTCPGCKKEFFLKVSHVPFMKIIKCPTCSIEIGQIKSCASN